MIGSDALIPAVCASPTSPVRPELRPLVHPNVTPPARAGYTPSRSLADFVRCRDLTCRFPGCDTPAMRCDLDHTIPYRDGGRTHASNLKSLCRLHHLIKTFWAWRDQQLPDGTLIWTSPSGQTYVTTPGSAVLFPSLCVPTPAPGPPDSASARAQCADRAAMMPQRRRTRAQNRANYVAAERRHNQRVRLHSADERLPIVANDEPPPF